MKPKHQNKKEYLTRKMLDGARALHDFFEELTVNRNSSPGELAQSLANRHELTLAQRNFFEQVTTRTSRAQEIVRYAEDRFGIDEQGRFGDVRGLYSCLYGTKRSPSDIVAQSYNIAIGFTKPKWVTPKRIKKYMKRDALGFTNYNLPADRLNIPLEQTIQRFEEGNRTDCSNLSFCIPDLEYLEELARRREINTNRTDEERIFRALFGPSYEQTAKVMQNEIKKHELRHIIDHILCVRHSFPEFVADLYSINPRSQGLTGGKIHIMDLDTFGLISKVESLEENLAALQRNNFPQGIIKNRKKTIEEAKRQDQEFWERVGFIKEAFQRIPEEEYPVASYVISTTTADHSLSGITKLAHRLDLLAGNYC